MMMLEDIKSVIGTDHDQMVVGEHIAEMEAHMAAIKAKVRTPLAEGAARFEDQLQRFKDQVEGQG